MIDDNVVQMRSPLERLAVQIRHDLEICKAGIKKTEEGRRQWIDGAFGLCVHLAEARDDHRADIAFGEWCEANGFGDGILNHQTRAAAIAMGRQPDALRACLEATKRSSLHTIHEFEFSGFTNICKPLNKPRKSRRQETFDLAATREVVRPLIEQGQPVNRSKLADLLNVSQSTVHMADLIERGRLEGLTEAKDSAVHPLTVDEMTPTTKRRYEATIRTVEKRLREEIKAEIHGLYDIYVKHLKEQSDRAERIVRSHNGVMSREVFRKIKACLHPDHNTFVFAAEALQIFSGLETILVKPEVPALKGPPLPATVAELLARKAEFTEQRKRQQRK